MRQLLPALKAEGRLSSAVVEEIHRHFEYARDVEYSGQIDMEHGEMEFTKHQGSASPFPWGPDVVFHTHPRVPGAQDHSYPDFFLFCCSPARVSLLFSEHHVSALEKEAPGLPQFDELREKLEFLRSGGHLQSAGGSNSLYFSAILERKFPQLRRTGTFKKKFELLCEALRIRQQGWEIP